MPRSRKHVHALDLDWSALATSTSPTAKTRWSRARKALGDAAHDILTASHQPSSPAPPPTTGLLAAPGTPPAAQIPPAIPTEQAPDESLGALWLRHGIAARAARPPGRARPDRSGL